MIITGILYLFYYIVYVLTLPLTLLGDVSENTNYVSAISNASSYIGPLDNFLPIGTIITVLSAIFVIEIVLAVYKVIMWVARRIPTQS